LTALEKAKQKNPALRPDYITRFGCPSDYGVGNDPEWCIYREKLGKSCSDCWDQKTITNKKAS
jgi:hypothetical protein